jgi:plastocyanin
MKIRKRIAFWVIVLLCAFSALSVALRKVNSAAPLKATDNVAASSVAISNLKFDPRIVTVKIGSVVTWENKEGVHTVTADSNAFSSPTLTPGKSFSHKFVKAGKYPYYCSFHGRKGGGDMSGVVIVTK